jgi:hypothetical protein
VLGIFDFFRTFQVNLNVNLGHDNCILMVQVALVFFSNEQPVLQPHVARMSSWKHWAFKRSTLMVFWKNFSGYSLN